MFEDLLDLFKRQYYRVQKVRIDFTPTKEQWYSWNYWAQHTQKIFSFNRWMAEHNLEFDDIKAKARYPHALVIYDREEGYRYYSAWRGGQYAVDEAEAKFDRIFRRLWEARNIAGQYIYSSKMLGKAIGKDSEQFRKFAAKRSWYTPRDEKGN